MICPNCGKDFPHSCSAALGRSARGKLSAKKSLASSANLAKARQKRMALLGKNPLPVKPASKEAFIEFNPVTRLYDLKQGDGTVVGSFKTWHTAYIESKRGKP